MERFLLQLLTLQIPLLLCLAHTYQQLPAEYDMYQREVIPEFPIIVQSEVRPPFLIQEESVLSPRGRRPSKGLTTSTGNNLQDFPPGYPSPSNIGNICSKKRPKINYGPHNLPQTGFSHLSRQGGAINSMEEGYAECCRQSGRLHCLKNVWKTVLQDFCDEEFSVKTRHYHCCTKKGSERETCFSKDASNPSYSIPPKPADLHEIGSADAPSVGSPRSVRPCSPSSPKCHKDSKFKHPDLSFPPGEPKSSNIQNICKLRKLRPFYAQSQLPQSGFGHYVRQAKTINRLEKEYKKCCKDDNVPCAHTAWEKVLAQFCGHEKVVKSKHYECCKKRDRVGMYHCFASNAPYPEYDREVDTMDLSNITEETLSTLCGDSKLLTKQKQVPLLVSGLRESCCMLPSDTVQSCAEEQKEKYIEALCSSKKDVWKDSHDCCIKENPEKEECFNSYLQNVMVAVNQRKPSE
ncbi:extracellular matrix protein 1 [Bombina bombina]|uniref:extracellular matrix protein 1 n=1 Tax=Bombina bombina TaxID=8345 RepID=UPI00235AC45C|nr:extracellular matrix protein 1 [Bombina bombina]